MFIAQQFENQLHTQLKSIENGISVEEADKEQYNSNLNVNYIDYDISWRF